MILNKIKFKLFNNFYWSIKELKLDKNFNLNKNFDKNLLEKWYKLAHLKFPQNSTCQENMLEGCEELIKLVGNVKELNLKGVEALSRLEVVDTLDLTEEEKDCPLQKDGEWALERGPIRRENYFITKSV